MYFFLKVKLIKYNLNLRVVNFGNIRYLISMGPVKLTFWCSAFTETFGLGLCEAGLKVEIDKSVPISVESNEMRRMMSMVHMTPPIS